MLDYIEFSRTNLIVKFSNLHCRCLSTPSSPCLPQGEAERASCNMISLHKDVSGV